MVSELEAFLRGLAGGELAPVYLLGGEEPLQLKEAGDALRARARAVGFGEREVLDVEPRFDWDQLARSGANLSLFSARRLIELRLPTGRPDRDGAAAITGWCKASPPDTVLLISAQQWSRKHEGAWVKAVQRVGRYVRLRAPRLDELPGWIHDRMRAHGFTPSEDAVALLAVRAEGNLLAIAQEIDKLAVLRDGGPVEVADLDSLGADNAQYDVFKLTDAAFGGDAARALRVLAGLRAEGGEVIALQGWLVNQLDLALRLASGPDFETAARAEYGMWPARRRTFAGALQRAGRGDIHWRRCLAWCARIDRMAKGRETGDPWREMERLMVAIAQPRAAATLLAA